MTTIHKCACGEMNPDNFYPNRKSKCKKCVSADNCKRYQSLSESEKVEYKRRQVEWQTNNRFQYRWLQAKKRAERKGLQFTILTDHLEELWEKQSELCYYSGRLMTIKPGKDTVSIDRIDSTQGYTNGNVVLCCSVVNIMKGEMSTTDFLQVVRELCDHQGK